MMKHPRCQESGCQTGRGICSRGVCVLAIGTADEASGPSLLEQAGTFGKAIVRHVAGGMKHVSPEEKAARLAICRACEKFDAERVRCKACGCRLRKKAAWRLEKCPLKKWPGDGD